METTGRLEKPLALATYRINGAVADFTINADGNIPGISGFTGTVDGDEKGFDLTPEEEERLAEADRRTSRLRG